MVVHWAVVMADKKGDSLVVALAVMLDVTVGSLVVTWDVAYGPVSTMVHT